MELSRRLESRLSKLATTDDLTQALNRRRFLELAGEAFARARADATALSVAVMDLDDFKHINDSHGHAAGDEVLQCVAHAVADMIGTNAVFARTGGEEFALLFAGRTPEAAATSCEQIRARISELRVSSRCADVISLTISVGIAAMRTEDETFDAMLARADAALYMAKKDGRNRVRAHPEPAPC
ncbi:MAG: hypothetical protein B7Y12_22130 [Rhizobiales bacterium 24-66-13]|nr:MAG: hypothetical protein B7Y12_22130 [Rhizobiales bacterium 24-66-13]